MHTPPCSHGSALAMLAVAAVLAGCGGGGDAAQSSQTSTSGVSRYAVFKADDGQPFGLADAGSVSTSVGAPAQLDLSDGQQVPIASAQDSASTLEVSRLFADRVLLLCPKDGSASALRYAAVATVGTGSAQPIYDAQALAGERFVPTTGCDGTPSSSAGSAELHTSAHGDLMRSTGSADELVVTAADLTSILHGMWPPGSRYAAFRLNDGGAGRTLIVERDADDEIDRSSGRITLWVAL